ncbi:MAG: hypothetical protein EHM55_09720 [Acidobacteria bacterium]|nr:MAG: hypothetical protein EHM55_09720 [Acidobacteriota bacterium]
MARGWDSKAVEDQQAAAETEKLNRSKPAVTAEERERQARREVLLLARAKLVNDLAAAGDERYRTMLEQAIAHLDRELVSTDQ